MKPIIILATILMFFVGSASADTYLVKWKNVPLHAKTKAYQHILDGKLTRMDLSEAEVDDIAEMEDVEYIEKDSVFEIDLTPNDPYMPWGMLKISGPEAWDITIGSYDVAVGVIDTGIDYTHPDLAGNVWTNPWEIPGNGIDDDGNGYIDDIHGINAITNVGDPMDDHGHGTHCSGTIGAVGNNGIGVPGVNWSISLIGCKFLSSTGSGVSSNAIECFNYFRWLKDHGVNVKVLSNSWGGSSYSLAFEQALDAISDFLFVAAAGNASKDIDIYPHYPASYTNPNVLAVASTTSIDSLSSFSNWGSASVDIGAPGSGILSTIIGGYGLMSGTSMATPHVAGGAGLLLSYGDLSVSGMKSRLMDLGDPIAALAGKTVSGKRLNVYASLGVIPPPPPPPSCGDGTCNGNETCSTCPEDCGECPPPPPENQLPIADFNFFAVHGRQVQFRSLSVDPDGMIVSYLWRFGDGRTSVLANPKHNYRPGIYSASLTVKDNRGGTDTITKTVQVVNRAGGGK